MTLVFYRSAYFWGMVSLFGFLLATRRNADRKLDTNLFKAYMGMLLPLAGQVMLVLPLCPQPRFSLGGWHWWAGSLFLFIAAGWIISGLVFSSAWRRDRLQIPIRIGGPYEYIRNPVYLGLLLLAFGLAVGFRSLLGVVLMPVWFLGALFLTVVEEKRFHELLGPAYLEYKRTVPGRFLPRTLFRHEVVVLSYPFKNLVFRGGGVKGMAYVGVLEGLDQRGILDQIERVGGASVGAITAMLVSFRLSLAETLAFFDTMDFSRVTQQTAPFELRRWPAFLEREINELAGDVEGLRRLLRKYGWYSSEYVYEWVQHVIAVHCDGNRRATFVDFRQRGFRDLYMVATNISRGTAEVFSADTTPDVAVADAVRLSMSIPLYFEALQFDGQKFGQGDFYIDGGVLNNYPVQIFDQRRFAVDNPWFLGEVNWETLGCFLYNPGEFRRDLPIRNFRDYMSILFENMSRGQQFVAFENSRLDRRRTIKIDIHDVESTDFFIQPGDAKYQEMVEAGRQAAIDYLDQYVPPASLLEEEWL
jgi:NTE family protein